MFKTILILFISVIILNAKINTIVSIVPQKVFVKAIGGNNVNIKVMVKPGSSPHTYSPKPSQMKAISKANIYFSIGVEFENNWLQKFRNQNKTMKIVNLSSKIKKINHNPHIWLSPKLVKIMAKDILDTLKSIDKTHKSYYEDNYKKFISDSNDVFLYKIFLFKNHIDLILYIDLY